MIYNKVIRIYGCKGNDFREATKKLHPDKRGAVQFFSKDLRLLTQTKSLNDGTVALDVAGFQVVQQRATLTNQSC